MRIKMCASGLRQTRLTDGSVAALFCTSPVECVPEGLRHSVCMLCLVSCQLASDARASDETPFPLRRLRDLPGPCCVEHRLWWVVAMAVG